MDPGGTQTCDYWLLKQPSVFSALPAQAGPQAAFADADVTVEFTIGRRDRLDAAIVAMASYGRDSEFTPLVRRLSCLRGISTLTAFTLAVEIMLKHDWDRFVRGRDRRVRRGRPTASRVVLVLRACQFSTRVLLGLSVSFQSPCQSWRVRVPSSSRAFICWSGILIPVG